MRKNDHLIRLMVSRLMEVVDLVVRERLVVVPAVVERFNVLSGALLTVLFTRDLLETMEVFDGD